MVRTPQFEGNMKIMLPFRSKMKQWKLRKLLQKRFPGFMKLNLCDIGQPEFGGMLFGIYVYTYTHAHLQRNRNNQGSTSRRLHCKKKKKSALQIKNAVKVKNLISDCILMHSSKYQSMQKVEYIHHKQFCFLSLHQWGITGLPMTFLPMKLSNYGHLLYNWDEWMRFT